MKEKRREKPASTKSEQQPKEKSIDIAEKNTQ